MAAIAIGIVVVLLLVFGINGCLKGRKEQSLKDYNRNVASVVQDSNANAEEFFRTLVEGNGQTSTDVQSAVSQLRFKAQDLTKQATRLSVPGDMAPAQRNLLLALSLLQESIGKVAEKLPAALATDSDTAVPAVEGIAGEMQEFTAADVIYNARVVPLITQVLEDNGIGGQVIQNSTFMQNLGWLTPTTVAKRIGSSQGRGAGDGGAVDPAPGAHGHALISTAVGATTLTAGKSNIVTTSGNPTFNVVIANQGDNPEANVTVRVRVSGAGVSETGQAVVDQTTPGTQMTVPVKLKEAPPVDTALQITAQVQAVPGERQKQNNSQSYPVLFHGG